MRCERCEVTSERRGHGGRATGGSGDWGLAEGSSASAGRGAPRFSGLGRAGWRGLLLALLAGGVACTAGVRPARAQDAKDAAKAADEKGGTKKDEKKDEKSGPPDMTPVEESIPVRQWNFPGQPKPPMSDTDVPGQKPQLGFSGDSLTYPIRPLLPRETIPSPDRWRIGWPDWNRYGRRAPEDPILMNNTGGDVAYTLGHPLNPYDRNVLKGDYAIIGHDVFMNVTAVSDTFVQYRKNPTPSGNSSQNPGAFDFFGNGRQFAFNQNFFLTLDVFQGYTAFRPIDFLFRVTPVFNLNYARLYEKGGVFINPIENERYRQFTTLQEAFFEYHLGDVSEYFDTMAVKIGRQLFVSDFRGFIYNDISDGIKFSGNALANRVQYNLYAANQTEKDTNSGLSELNWRQQQVLIANAYLQDWPVLGYTVQGSFHWNHDTSNARLDSNGFPARPDLVGNARVRDIDAYYLGFAGDGKFDRLNVSHAFYYVLGKDSENPLAGREVDISAFMAAIELSVDFDWLRPKVSFLYASGDRDPSNKTATGFDAILDDPNFAGGPGSFFQNQGPRLFGVGLKQPRSLLNTLKSSKIEGQSNFVNPGTMLFNVGVDAELTPHLRTQFNTNFIYFAETESLELLLNQPDVRRGFGTEFNLLTQWRPFLNNNVILTGSASAFVPGGGFRDIYGSSNVLYQMFLGVTLTY